MRALTALVVLPFTLPAVAAADVWQDRVLECPPGAEAALTNSSRILYVNDCKPGGCAVTRSSADSAITNTSSIASKNTTMGAYMHSDAHFQEVMQCVRETMAPFNIQVVTDDPGNTPHFEVMVAGTSAELNPNISGAGGIAPFINCAASRDSVLSFVFANMTSDIEYLCTAIVHEAGHTYGLSHTLHALDPMSYKDLGAYVKQWQNAPQTCGIEDASPQSCSCFPSQQNTFRALKDAFGLNPSLGEPTLTIARPGNGAFVKPGFPISASFTAPLDILSLGMTIDGGTPTPATNGIAAWNAPASLAPGPHEISVAVTDFGDRTAMQTVNVTVLASCEGGAACAAGTLCLGGTCHPDQNATGGLGAACTGPAECSTGQCASDGSTSACTAACDPGDVCPSGFSCDGGICWRASDGGGCNAAGSPLGALSVSAIFGFLALRRPRRRAART